MKASQSEFEKSITSKFTHYCLYKLVKHVKVKKMVKSQLTMLKYLPGAYVLKLLIVTLNASYLLIKIYIPKISIN